MSESVELGPKLTHQLRAVGDHHELIFFAKAHQARRRAGAVAPLVVVGLGLGTIGFIG